MVPKTGNGGHRADVVQRAAQIYESVKPGTRSTSIEGILAPLPTNDAKTQQRRENLFKVQATRQKLLMLTKDMTDTQHGLAKSLVVRIDEATEPGSTAEMSTLLQELALLDQVKASTKSALSASKLNKTGIAVLDELLLLVPENKHKGLLYILFDDEMFPVYETEGEDEPGTLANAQSEDADGDEEDVDADYADKIAAAIQTTYGIPISFLGNITLNHLPDRKDHPFRISKVKTKLFDGIQASEPIRGSSVLDGPALKKLDGECSKVTINSNWSDRSIAADKE